MCLINTTIFLHEDEFFLQFLIPITDTKHGGRYELVQSRVRRKRRTYT